MLTKFLETLSEKLPAVLEASQGALNGLFNIMTPWALHLDSHVLLSQIYTANLSLSHFVLLNFTSAAHPNPLQPVNPKLFPAWASSSE